MKLFEFQLIVLVVVWRLVAVSGGSGYLYPLSPSPARARGYIQERQTCVQRPPPGDDGFVMDLKCTLDNCREAPSHAEDRSAAMVSAATSSLV